MTGKIPVVSHFSPEIETPGSIEWPIERGPAHITPKTFKTNPVSDTSITIEARPPNSDTFMSPYVQLELDINFKFTALRADWVAAGSNPAFLIEYGVTDSLRAYPLASIIRNLNMKINSSNISTSTNSYIHEIMRYRNNVNKKSTITPTTLDNSQQYSDFVGTQFNSLGNYSNSTPGMPGRGTFKVFYDSGVCNDGPNDGLNAPASINVIQYITMRITEYLMIPPLMYGDKPTMQALFGIDTMDFTLQLDKLSLAWSRASGMAGQIPLLAGDDGLKGTFAGFTAYKVGAPGVGEEVKAVNNGIMKITYLSPNVTQSVPRSNLYPYVEYKPYFTDITNYIAAGANSTRETSRGITVTAVPKKIYIFIKKKLSKLTYLDTDSYASITQIAIEFSNQNNLLGSATQSQIFQMCADNGLMDNYEMFKNRVGSVVCLEFGNQIELPPGIAPGVAGQFNISVDVNYQNVDFTGGKAGAPSDFALGMILEQDGMLQIFDNTSVLNTGVITPNDVLEAGQRPADPSTMHEVSGAGYGSLLKTAAPIIRQGIPLIRGVLDAAETAVNLIPEGRGRIGGALSKDGMTMNSTGSASGGRVLSKSELRSAVSRR